MLSHDTYFLMAEQEYTALLCHNVVNIVLWHAVYTAQLYLYCVWPSTY
jgi:hypothetical protein